MDYIFLLRGIERLAIVSIAGLSILGGVRLFRQSLSDRGYASAAFQGWKVELKNLGPGVFFALFGSTVLVFAMTTQIDVQGLSADNHDSGGSQASVSQLSFESLFNEKDIAALNAVIDLIEPAELEFETHLDRSDFEEALQAITQLKRKLLAAKFGTQNLELWDRYKLLLDSQPENIPNDEILVIVQEIDRWADAGIYQF